MEAALRTAEQHRDRTDAGRGLTAPLDLVTSTPAIESRIAELAARSAEMASERNLYKNDDERLAAESMKRPVSTRASFTIFGAAIGFLPTFSVTVAILLNSVRYDDKTLLWAMLFSIAAAVTGGVGGLMGRYAARLVENARAKRLSVHLSLLPFIGAIWGGAAGALGGVFLFVIGAFFGAVIGGLIGFVTVPIFSLLHTMMRQGDSIELGHLLPIIFAIVGTLSAAILSI